MCLQLFRRKEDLNLYHQKFQHLHLGGGGRIYRKSNGCFLIGTQDQALWITKALFTDDESSAYTQLNVYDRLSTIHQFAELHLNKNENR